jgi:hypothetical protein
MTEACLQPFRNISTIGPGPASCSPNVGPFDFFCMFFAHFFFKKPLDSLLVSSFFTISAERFETHSIVVSGHAMLSLDYLRFERDAAITIFCVWWPGGRSAMKVVGWSEAIIATTTIFCIVVLIVSSTRDVQYAYGAKHSLSMLGDARARAPVRALLYYCLQLNLFGFK